MRFALLFCLLFAVPAFSQDDGLDLPIGPTQSGPLRPKTVGDPVEDSPPVLYGEEVDSASDSIVYVIDISGSMDWDGRIDRAKQELTKSINGLSRNFRFDIVAYSCSTKVWAKTLQEANDANKASAATFVASLQPTDATGTGPAVALGLSLDRTNLTVVLLTDGAPNCGTPRQMPDEHQLMIRRCNTQDASITVFGIAAYGNYRAFCQDVASDNHGSYFDVP